MKKKIIFILCTIVILCIGGIVSAATSLGDVKNTKYEDSVNTLISLGVVNGYPEDNTYRPNNTVTRAEMAKLMVVCLGEESNVANAKKSSPKFSDVKSSDWEYGYVNLAAELGIINGYPDGTFGSRNTVSYAEATAMIIRALEYEEEVKKSTEYWPNNYINQAKKLSLYDSVGTINSSDGAKRGNVAILLWNMLRTGVCSVVGENASGLVYGEGTSMINKKMTSFLYLEDALVSSVIFDDAYEEAEVKFSGTNTIKVEMDALEAAEMYGQKFNVLYNKSNKKILQIEECDNTVKEGEITKLLSNKIYIKGGSSKGYTIPDDKNILLYGIDDLDEAVTATLVFSGSTVKYIIAYAPEEVYFAYVTDNNVTVSDKKGIKVLNYKSSSAKSYALADEANMPNKEDVILYYLNSDEKLVVINSTNVFSSKEVDTASSTKIKLGSASYTLSATPYQIVKVSSGALKSMSPSAIEEDVDSAVMMYFGGQRYFVVYIGGVGKALEQLEKDIDTACNALSSYKNSSSVKNAYNAETTYTLETYTKFSNLYNEATTAINTAQKTANLTNLNKVKKVHEDLKAAYAALKKVANLSATDKAAEQETINLKISLRKLVNGTTTYDNKKVTTCVSSSGDYTKATYTVFETALKNANTILTSTTATYNRIEIAKSDLEAAMKGLLKVSDSDKITAARVELTKALNEAKKVGKANEYTSASYSNFSKWWTDANRIDAKANATEQEIKDVTLGLNNAIELLEKNIEKALNELNELLLDAQVELRKTDVYMTESYNDLSKAYESGDKAKNKANVTSDELEKAANDLNIALEGLINASEKLTELKTKASNYGLKAIADIVKDMAESTLTEKELKIKKLDEAMKNEDELISFYTDRLNRKISEAKEIKESNWSTAIYKGTFAEMKTALNAAEATKIKDKVTSEELEAACKSLEKALELK